MSASAILQLKISRFRGISGLDWRPSHGLNLILGGGDAGKTTILDAIALLFSPTNPANLPDTDFYRRELPDGFSIEAVLSLPDGEINNQTKQSWPWDWNGLNATVPGLNDDQAALIPVYCVRVRGTEDLELIYEVLQPDGSVDNFPVALRRQIGLVRLLGDDRNDRDLRLVQGSALDRLLSDKSLRSRMASKLAKTDIQSELADAAKNSLAELDAVFRDKRLPSSLDLQITGGQGASIASMIGLTAERDGVTLPLASWGAGTRRLAALTIAERNQGSFPITVVDEIERGLEPYRQAVLIEKLQTSPCQVFITSHSPTSISAAAKATLWYVDHTGNIGEIKGAVTDRHRKNDPEMFLSRLAIIAEGITEQGMVLALTERTLGGPLKPHGLRVCDGGGHDDTLELLKALGKSGLRFGGFVDQENRWPDLWNALQQQLGTLLFRWEKGCTEEEIISVVSDSQLEELITDPTGEKTGERLRTLARRLKIGPKDFASIRAAAGEQLKPLIIAAACGKVPEGAEADRKAYRSDAQHWFKTVDGGRELADKLFKLCLWQHFSPRLLPFLNAIREAVGLDSISALS